MGRITDEQKSILDQLKVVRVSSLPNAEILLGNICGKKRIDESGKEVEDELYKNFCEEAKNDTQSNIASYLILTPNDLVLQFFTIRCGELFVPRIDTGYQDVSKMFKRVKYSLKTTSTSAPSSRYAHKKDPIAKTFKMAVLSGHDPRFASYHLNSIMDKYYEGNSSCINQVDKIYPSIEIKYWGSNGDSKASAYWKSLNMPKQYTMGQVLFWYCVVNKIQEATNVVGTQYVYLFAADKEPDGTLVKYYQTFGFAFPTTEHVNKPSFDWQCKFMLQVASDLLKGRMDFLDGFNSDSPFA